MMLALTQHMKLAELFWTYALARDSKYQKDLVDQHCNGSEKRLARTILMSAHLEEPGAPETRTAKMSYATLAEIVGTTRSRICFHEQVQEIGLHRLREQRQAVASPSNASCFLC
jgi:CRP/FNR family cyclic AMP-dependent transcriptional regulator